MSSNYFKSNINRRESIKRMAAGALLGSGFLQACGRKASLESVGLKLAVQQYSFNRQLRSGELSLLDYPKTVAEGTGIRALEYYNGHIEDKVGNIAYFKELKKRCDEVGASNTMMLCRSKPALDSGDPKIRALAVEGYKPWMEATKILGGNTIRVDCRSKGDFEEQKKHATAGLTALCGVAAGMEMDIVVENHGSHSGNGKWVAEVMQRVNLPNCGTLPDFQNFADYDPYLGVEEMMPWAKIVCAKSKEFDDLGNEVNVDYARMIKIVLNSGYKGYVGIEFEGHDVDPISGINATKALIERVVAEI
ncbi:MAG: TIM barrel protein [Verrucomicrobiota bacterium]